MRAPAINAMSIADARRRGVRRTALAVGALALAIYVLFMLSWMIGK